jgi:hypothetical protein
MDQWTEDRVIQRAAKLYREWEARPWHVKLRGRLRAALARRRMARKGWGA